MTKVPDVRDRGSNCVVCGGPAPRNFGVVAAGERLCMVNDEVNANCFGWFSGYPWVLFEAGQLTSDLREYDLEVRTWI